MRLLWVKANLLHPLDSGGTIRTYHMLRHLREEHDITYAALVAPGQEAAVASAQEYCHRLVSVPWPGAPRRTQPRFYVQAFRNLFSDLPLALARYAVPALRSTVATLTRNAGFDVAVADFLFPAPAFAEARAVPKILFQHNVETLIWDRLASHARSPLRFYLSRQAARMRRWEATLAAAFDGVITVSEEDAALMREWFGVTRLATVPTGVDTAYFHPAEHQTTGADVVFVGSLDWLPNIDGVTWFLSAVWPTVRRQVPQARLHLVGRRPSPQIRRLAHNRPDVVLWPDVPDVRPHLWPAAVVIVPLRVGGGTRLKIYEALACGKALVTTPVGVEGLRAEPGVHLLVSGTEDAFAKDVVRLLVHDGARRDLEVAGRDLVVHHLGWDQAARAFSDACIALSASRRVPHDD